MRRALVLLFLAACGPNVSFDKHETGSEPVPSTYGNVASWSLTEGVAVALTMRPSDANVTFVADDTTIVRVQETSSRGTFIVMPLSPGKTTLRTRGESARAFSVEVHAQ